MPNAIAVPNDPSDEDDIRAAQAANDAAEYFRQKCDLQSQTLYLVFSLFVFGTNFWHIDFVFDGEKYGYADQPQMEAQPTALGGAGYDCPQCGADVPTEQGAPAPDNCPQCGAPMTGAMLRTPQTVDMPNRVGTDRQEKGGLEISIHNVSEISVPLDCETVNRKCAWLMEENEQHKAFLLKEFGDAARNVVKDASGGIADQTVASQYGEAIRSAMASPIGVIRTQRDNKPTVRKVWWDPAMYEMVDDAKVRNLLQENFPTGLKSTAIKGKIIKLEEEKFSERWQECKPEPSMRIMGDPLGDDWVTAQDIGNQVLEMEIEIIERSAEPGFADPRRLDMDAYQRRREYPGELIPAVPPAGGNMADIIYRPPALEFSEQVPAVKQAMETQAQDISGLTPAIWGGGTDDPTARQTELKTNAAIRQLGIVWIQIGKSLEKVYEKACRLTAQFQDGVLAFSKKNQFGGFDQVAVQIDDLKNGAYHFESDEAIPMTWGQQRDLMMWMLSQSGEVQQMFGLSDPLNVPELKRLLGMPGERVPKMDDRNKGMEIIAQLMKEKPGNAPPDPNTPPDPQTGQPVAGPPQSSIQPDWCDDSAFMSQLAKAWLTQNFRLQQTQPDGYQNVQLWGQAHEKIANAPAPAPPPKTSIALSVKSPDIGDAATQAALDKAGLLPDGVQAVHRDPIKVIPGQPQPNGAPGPMPPPMPAPIGPVQ